ncbi:MAG TPA: hypothetical protein VG892_01505 [Terriglobales bacterium]|jgi:hypothetical protein|nr:hypothetical protein [Terriglobales bacterium]
MKLFARLIGISLCGMVVCGLAWANGSEFFDPGDQIGLYYYGHIKDVKGKPLTNVIVNVAVKDTALKFPVRNDAPGHFRTPDVGNAIKGLGQKIDPSKIQINVVKEGYRQVSPASTTAPNRAANAVGIEFVMEPIAGK